MADAVDAMALGTDLFEHFDAFVHGCLQRQGSLILLSDLPPVGRHGASEQVRRQLPDRRVGVFEQADPLVDAEHRRAHFAGRHGFERLSGCGNSPQ